jgi:uncharacterized repeat protein (TIGR04042 family)
MPEMYFLVRWPAATETMCYSPSLIIREYFTPGETYRMPDFVERSRVALTIASDRVRAKYGYECTSAKAQLAEIERTANKYADDAHITVVGFQ